MSLTLPNLLLHKTLRNLDNQAKPLKGGYPTGLWWYVGHLDRDKPKPRKLLNSEVEWTRAMARVLDDACVAEMRFPGSSQRCDVVMPVKGKTPLWIEVKGSWRECYDGTSTRKNASYIKHLHAAAADVAKLKTLKPKDASGVAFVLVGFDRKETPISANDLKIIRAKTRGWHETERKWTVKCDFPFRTRVWVWSRLLRLS